MKVCEGSSLNILASQLVPNDVHKFITQVPA